MIKFVFVKPIPVAELEGELRAFVRDVAKEGFDTVSGMVIALRPTRAGEPFEFLREGSDVPITEGIYECRLYEPRRKKSRVAG